MKPFAFLECRPRCTIADDEYEVMLRVTGFDQTQMQQIWLNSFHQEFDFTAYSAIIVSGSPYGYHTAESEKSDEQIKIEKNIAAIVKSCLARDYPFLGICYGLQAIAVHESMPLTKEYPEDIDAVMIELNDAGRSDPIFGQLPERFYSITGHNDALALPLKQGILLASSPTCPVQAVRFGKNVYGLQFHPEICTSDSLEVRLATYAGKYFAVGAADTVRKNVREKNISVGETLIRTFVEHYRKD